MTITEPRCLLCERICHRDNGRCDSRSCAEHLAELLAAERDAREKVSNLADDFQRQLNAERAEKRQLTTERDELAHAVGRAKSYMRTDEMNIAELSRLLKESDKRLETETAARQLAEQRLATELEAERVLRKRTEWLLAGEERSHQRRRRLLAATEDRLVATHKLAAENLERAIVAEAALRALAEKKS
jgi:hypothetical protein